MRRGWTNGSQRTAADGEEAAGDEDQEGRGPEEGGGSEGVEAQAGPQARGAGEGGAAGAVRTGGGAGAEGAPARAPLHRGRAPPARPGADAGGGVPRLGRAAAGARAGVRA